MVQFAEILGCRVGSLPTTYLGLPLCLWTADKSLWSLVVERIEKRLTAWKASYLSIGSRVTLIKSALSSLPIYYMSMFKCPISVANWIEKLQRDFLWNGRSMENKFYLVDWKTVCKSKLERGLGLRPVMLMNRALLGKWLWRSGNETEGLWRQLVLSKYGIIREGWEIKDMNYKALAIWKALPLLMWVSWSTSVIE